MTRPSRALIDLGALRSNYIALRRLHGGRALATIKANAYGHGALMCAQALEGLADGFAVAFLEEALILRAAGIASPVLILEGCFSIDELREACARNLWVVVHQERQLRDIEQIQHELRDLNVWLKMDSGMHRAGFSPGSIRDAHARLQACICVSEIVLMSHMARADEPACDTTARQIQLFDETTAGLPGARSLANSAAVMAWPEARRDWARPGIAIYGADPLGTNDFNLEPVMTLQSEVFAVRTLELGEALGYGAAYVAQRPTRVGLVAIGYADGYPRTIPPGTPVFVHGHRTSIIGRVSMDMLTVDLTSLPQASFGSVVELWGKHIGVTEISNAVGTIAYELLCGIQRVSRHSANTA